MKIAILGSGGREHALAYQISKSLKTEKIFCIPGNAGTSMIAENIDLDFIEILIREKFLFGKEGETTYIIKDNENNK